MKRGAVWTASGGGYAGKPRPVVIIQDDAFSATDSITIAPITTDMVAARLFRVPVRPSPHNGLGEVSSIMADKVTTIRKDRLGKPLGELSASDMTALNRAIALFLGLGGDGADVRSA